MPPENVGFVLQKITDALTDHGEAIAVLRERHTHIVEDRTKCNQQHTKQLEELAQTVGKLAGQVADGRDRLNIKLELIKGAVVIVVALLTLGIGGRAALPTVTEAVAKSVTQAVSAELADDK